MPAYFITGTDESGVKREAAELIAKLSRGLDDFGLDTIDGAGNSPDETIAKIEETSSSLQSYPFFGNRKVVWLKNTNCFSDGGKSAEIVERLDALLAIAKVLLPNTVDFVVSSPNPDKRKTHYKQFVASFKTKVIDLPDFGFAAAEEDIVEWVRTQATNKQLFLDDDAAVLLAARIGAKPRQLSNELEKLDLASDGGAITSTLVRVLVPTTRAGNIFEMGSAISKRDPKMAMQTLQTLYSQKETPVAILLASVVPTIRNLLVAKELVEFYHIPAGDSRGATDSIKRLSPEVSCHLPKKKDGGVNSYGLGIAVPYSANFSLSELQNALCLCAEVNIELISGECEPEIALQKMILQILR